MKTIFPIRARFLASAAGALGSLAAIHSAPALAGPLTQPPPSAYAAVQRAEPAVAEVEPRQEEPACHQQRRRLWVDGEGWIIRRVTLCQ